MNDNFMMNHRILMKINLKKMGCYDWALHKEMAMIDDISGDVIMKNKAILGSKTPYK